MSAPVKHTCPDIDKAQKKLKSVMRSLAELDWEDKNYTISELDDVDDALEDLRKSNDALRQWGEELDKELEEAANTISNLETELELLK